MYLNECAIEIAHNINNDHLEAVICTTDSDEEYTLEFVTYPDGQMARRGKIMSIPLGSIFWNEVLREWDLSDEYAVEQFAAEMILPRIVHAVEEYYGF